MMKFLAGTALALTMASPTFAQQAADQPGTDAPAAAASAAPGTIASPGGMFLPRVITDAVYASELIGMDVYSSHADYRSYPADRNVSAADRSQWDDIGEINDVVLSPDGKTRAVLIDVGGFLGIGAHTVALDMSQVHFLRDESNLSFAAVNSSREELQNAPEYQRPQMGRENSGGLGGASDQSASNSGSGNAAPGSDNTIQNGMANSEADTTGNMGTNGAGALAGTASHLDNTGMMGANGTESGDSRPNLERQGYIKADYGTLTAEQLEGATVYDTKEENIGDIDQLVLGEDGKVRQAIVDVGGFLGIGAHRIALNFDEMQVMTNDDKSDVRVYIDQSRDALEKLPEYKS